MHSRSEGNAAAALSPAKSPRDVDSIAEREPVTMLSTYDYAELLRKHGVTDVVRLNNPSSYDRSAFLQAGFQHHDMPFSDGSPPSARILERFLEVMDASSGAVAVHCKAGLGRTGTLAAAYIMRNFGFSAREAMAWVRIVRPGSIVGPQQHFLDQLEAQVKRQRLDERAREDLKQGMLENQRRRMKRQAEAHAEHQAIQARKLGLGALVGGTGLQMSSSAPELMKGLKMMGNYGARAGTARASLSRSGQSWKGGQQQQLRTGVKSRGRLREFVPIVGPSPGSVNMMAGGTRSLSRPSTTIGVGKKLPRSGVRGSGGRLKQIPGSSRRRRTETLMECAEADRS